MPASVATTNDKLDLFAWKPQNEHHLLLAIPNKVLNFSIIVIPQTAIYISQNEHVMPASAATPNQELDLFASIETSKRISASAAIPIRKA